MARQHDEQLPLPHYEDRLWDELAALHRASGTAPSGGRGARRRTGSTASRRPRALLAASAAAVLVLVGLGVAAALGDDGGASVELVPEDEGPGGGSSPADCPPATTTTVPATTEPPTTEVSADEADAARALEVAREAAAAAMAGDADEAQAALDAAREATASVAERDDCPPSESGDTATGTDDADGLEGDGAGGNDAAAVVPTGPAMVVHQEQRNANGTVDRTWFDEETGRMRSLSLDATGNPVYESGWLSLETREDGTTVIRTRSVDHATGTYTDDDWTPPGPLPGDWRQDDEIEAGLARGTHVADGTEVIDGRELLRFVDALDGEADPELGVTWYDPETRRPVQRIGYPGSDVEYTHTYDHLPRTPENLAHLEVPIPAGFTPT